MESPATQSASSIDRVRGRANRASHHHRKVPIAGPEFMRQCLTVTRPDRASPADAGLPGSPIIDARIVHRRYPKNGQLSGKRMCDSIPLAQNCAPEPRDWTGREPQSCGRGDKAHWPIPPSMAREWSSIHAQFELPRWRDGPSSSRTSCDAHAASLNCDSEAWPDGLLGDVSFALGCGLDIVDNVQQTA